MPRFAEVRNRFLAEIALDVPIVMMRSLLNDQNKHSSPRLHAFFGFRHRAGMRNRN